MNSSGSFSLLQILVGLQPVIVAVRHVQPVFTVDIEAGRYVEFSRTGPDPAENKKQVALAVEDLYTAPKAVRHPDMPVTVDSDALRLYKIVDTGSRPPELGQEFSG